MDIYDKCLEGIQDRPKEYMYYLTAEECSELTQACIKMARAMNGWTPKSRIECYSNVVEEIADVMICLKLLCKSQNIPKEDVETVINRKILRLHRRWVEKDYSN